MCWRIDKVEYEKNPNCYHKVAEEDVIVYKLGRIIDGKFIPYFKCFFAYTANSLNKEVKLGRDIGLVYVSIDEGYHSYASNYKSFNELNLMMLLDGGLLNYKSDYEYVIGKFLIPKGSEYYENDKGDIVSSQLIWTGE